MSEEALTPSAPSREARKWATICHIIALVGLASGVGFLLGPLIVWLLKREDDPFIDEQGKEAVNFQITVILIFLIALILCLVLIGLLILWLIPFYASIFAIIAAIKANDGEHYRYPLTVRFLK